jgi:hypothetical protein
MIMTVLTGAAALGLVPGLGAQQKTQAPKKEPPPARTDRDGCFRTDDRTECRFSSRASFDSVLAKRAVLGVTLSPTGTKRDTLGVFVSRVTPKGPAENAGLVEGDRIVSINGIDLRVNSADAEDDYAAGLPQRRLTREVERLAPGNVVNLRVYSGGRTRDLQVTLGKASDYREMGGAFGALMPGGMGGVYVGPRDFDGMRMQLQTMPRIRMEQMQGPRMRIQEMPRMRFDEMPRMRIEELMPKLNELRDRMRIEHLSPGRYRIIGPDGERVFDGANSWTIGPDGVIIMRSNKDRVEAEKKAKTEKEKSSKKQ